MPQPDRAVLQDGGDEAVWAEARRLYEKTGTPAAEIAAMLGKSSARALYRLAERRGWAARPKAQVRENGRALAMDTPEGRKAAVSGRRQLIQKLERTVAREIAAIDARLRKFTDDEGEGGQGVDHERHARALATLARTLRELAAIDRTEGQAMAEQRAAQQEEGDDDDFPRDAAALRNALAIRLEQLSGERAARPVSGEL